MSTPAGAVAKAFLDALPSLDHNKLLGEVRRVMGIVVIGEEEPATTVIELLRAPGKIPSDVKLALWRHVPGSNAPVSLAQTELAIIVPATEEQLRRARESFSGVKQLAMLVGDQAAPADLRDPLKLSAIDAQQVRKVLVPALVEKLWDRRLALGRSVPATRDRIATRLILNAVRDVKSLLGSVAGAGHGRSGAPTPATAQILVHQAVLIFAIAAVYGAGIEDRRQLYAKVAPYLVPTMLVDQAEARLSDLASKYGGGEGGKNKDRAKLFGMAAAVVARPLISATGTLIAGLSARQVFRETQATDSRVKKVVRSTRDLGKRVASGTSQGAALAAGVLLGRARRPSEEAPAAAEESPVVVEQPSAAPSVAVELLPDTPPEPQESPDETT